MSIQITNTVNAVDKLRSISGTNFSNISKRIGKPQKWILSSKRKDVSDFSLPVDYLSGITPDILFITRKDRGGKTKDTLIITKQPIQESVNQSKREKEYT